MHRTEHCNRERGTFGLSAPRRRFRHPPDRCLQARRVRFRSGPAARNGLSLALNGCSLSEPPFQGQSSRPATSLPERPGALPVRTSTPPPLPVRPGQRRHHRVNPVAALPRTSNDCSRDLHSPSGLLHPSGSKRSTASATTRPASRIRSISVRSPKPVLFLVRLRIIVPGSLRFRWLAAEFCCARKSLVARQRSFL